MKTIGIDLRQRIVDAYDRGEGTREEIAEHYGVSLGFVGKLLGQRRRTGDLAPRHGNSGRNPKLVGTHRRQLRALLAKQPDLTLVQLQAALGVDCTVQAIHYVLAAMGLTYKKRRSGPANRIERTSSGRGGAGDAGKGASTRRG
jgi:transposase